MGRLIFPNRARAYLDANILIHVIEGHPILMAAIESLVQLIESQHLIVATSELSLVELLAKPLSVGNLGLAAEYEAMLSTNPELSVLPISRSILIEGAKLRGRLSLRTPDALHVATAAMFDSTYFVTEDRRIRVPDGIQLIRLKEFAE